MTARIVGIATGIAAGGVVAAAVTAAAVTATPPGPQIQLVDNTVAFSPGDGALADGQAFSPFDLQQPAIAKLDPRLLAAVQNAANAAVAEGITMTVTSGWRSPDFQQSLLDDAVQTYGSLAAAREYVQTPTASRHVTGEAVDIGGTGADHWLITNGPQFGLCQIYANESWHFELVADPLGNCPPLLPNAAG